MLAGAGAGYHNKMYRKPEQDIPEIRCSQQWSSVCCCCEAQRVDRALDVIEEAEADGVGAATDPHVLCSLLYGAARCGDAGPALETYEAAVTALKAAQGSYSLGLDDMKRDYKRLGKPIIDLVQEQIAYHRVRVWAVPCVRRVRRVCLVAGRPSGLGGQPRVLFLVLDASAMVSAPEPRAPLIHV